MVQDKRDQDFLASEARTDLEFIDTDSFVRHRYGNAATMLFLCH